MLILKIKIRSPIKSSDLDLQDLDLNITSHFRRRYPSG